ncbi:L-arabinonate dehydratase [Verminephrobacter eiseniae]|uniref:L-arabinonate dehydratase n=1 Tax=Verminephrobacter eiseniae TaxID=364317 RepID=UPI002237526A|nr:L-arabinonate dehydratase [Verminephrobacter eiseniae]MCW5232266.1 dihydroxy-acid dehydratase [Verminephrobacter eiseniae]MCW5296171.1 dihydroxy-acid dehydratase [Verminephrobacter eiseniae]MCW8185430.1 dihydroxy-acid dehydratase [Verminephrobacter eiseniae]MCW8224095.1 dihydroxy-acid dehydratase [Verminephrobacter eiseniae]MCW8235227.1 dihydroxy-acid dehydratase [Verminephrobacter eiseniae]
MTRKKIELSQLRSQRWFGAAGQPGNHKSYRTKQMGFTSEDFQGKPVIGILSTWSDLNSCHTHFPQRIEEVKRGIWQAGGFPVVMPTLSVGETYVRPSTLIYRNLLAMDAEEILRSHPIDGAVLLGGCDKTTPGLVMAAASMNIPAIFVPAGAMLRGHWRGQQMLGTGSSTWKALADFRAGKIDEASWRSFGEGTARSPGTCNTMGTASTMTSLVDVLGLTLPGASSIPAVDARHPQMASACGRRIVEMVWEDLRPRELVTRQSFLNAVVADMALSGSTNSLIHLVAMARRLGVELSLDDFAQAGEAVPVLCNLQPSGAFLMEDFYYAGGLLALLKRIESQLDLSCLSVNGRTLGENIAGAEVYNDDVIRPQANPVYAAGGLVVLRGNLAPRGAVLKRAAADPKLLQHTGPAVVFSNFKDLLARIDDPELAVTPDSVLVLQDSGPVGAPGMPEWGMLPIPRKLLEAGVRDMVRISDARMSGTSYGTCVLHVCPESRVGGLLGLVRDGDLITLDTAGRRLDLLVDDAELEARRKVWVAPPPHYERGFGSLHIEHVLQADEGCDLDFLARPGETPDPEARFS